MMGTATYRNFELAFQNLRVSSMQAYRIACHLGDQEENLDATMRITSSTVFNKILLFMIKEVHLLLIPPKSSILHCMQR